VAERGNVNAASDAGSAAGMAQACLSAAGLNVRINASSVKDEKAARKWLQELDGLHAQAEEAALRVRDALSDRANLTH
jgi:glutamate formiminotransferase/formiminotetrahydrofolate cyclodeaminase